KTPVIVLVFQDESLALIELKQAKAGLSRRGVRLGATPFEEIAQSYGGHGLRVSSRDELAQALKTAKSNETFSLIVCAFEAELYVDSI
ncbi:MAG: thiamine pyrophosphate-dependent enzyme, partial [Pseudomonadota bacterium]